VRYYVLVTMVALLCFATPLIGLIILSGSIGGNAEAAACVLSISLSPAKNGTSTATTTTPVANANCGAAASATLPSSTVVNDGLPSDYVVPADATAVETVAITYALAQLDKPYIWGGDGPNAFDCSGLTMMAWAQAGVTLLHYTGDQINEGTPVPSYADISPGDLVLVPGSDGTVVNPGHVGLYIGDGLVESAVDVKYGVIVQPYSYFVSGGLSGIRYVG
jgi:cell wall-associated NlpC family hydrolase